MSIFKISKKIILSVLIAILLCTGPLCVYAEEAFVVTAESQSVAVGESVTLPVSISNNKGIMGFRISVTYPDNELDLINVSSGSVTQEGSFNSTISDYAKVKGNFDVVWNYTENVKDDGTLFFMTFKVKKVKTETKCKIDFHYSQEDTFDEDFNDVVINCNPVELQVVNTLGSDAANTGKDTIIGESAKAVLEKFDSDSFSVLPKEDKEKAVNEVISLLKAKGQELSVKDYGSYDALADELDKAIAKLPESTATEKNNKIVFLIVLPIALCLAIFGIIIIVKVKKRNKRTN